MQRAAAFCAVALLITETESAYLRCIKYGRCLESLVRYTYAKQFPKYKAASSELIKLLKDKTFKQFLGKTEYYNKLHFTYLAGNNAAFDHDIDTIEKS